MTAERKQLNVEIGLLRRMVKLLERYSQLAHFIDSDLHLDDYRQWLQEAIAKRETL